MTDDGRTFTVANDAAVISLIESAKNRLVIIGPAFSEAVAEALTKRFGDLGQLDIRVVMDADAEVYRLGFGEPKALSLIREAAAKSFLDLREQSGVRIGVIISDDATMVYSPVSRNIEAGSETVEKPNAIVLSGASTEKLVRASGASREEDAPPAEIGTTALDAGKAAEIEADLERLPPVKFDVSRRVNVFHSRLVYVEFEIKGFAISRKQVPLPEDFKTVTNVELQAQLSTRLRAPMADIGPVEVQIECDDEGNAPKPKKIDDKWLRQERKRIEDRYTFQVDHYGRVILREDMPAFTDEVNSFKAVVERYHEKLRDVLAKQKDDFCKTFSEEFFPKWKDSPPEYIVRWGDGTDDTSLKAELKIRAGEVFEEMLNFAPPTVRLVEKNISPRNVEDEKFLEPLKQTMIKRRVRREIIDTLFSTNGAAPVKSDARSG
ncbi:hypothetical protein [Marivita sp. XM-24bin2]|jgi:hypothetical protein|uniref:hypothetical protein n=1 Tax=Marivita sp. XM-24bin2 TaxID=2133951 RepID=UPI000D7AFBD8|nr:hypothetical protein [Marivita sp. XM-24bin2]MCR9111156.1 hypothetical protein [Paracoccaceae bacterium]PWL32752.1 MAG: hypothetical protein DCO97_20960 [Marivita sp. XM-24bin2]